MAAEIVIYQRKSRVHGNYSIEWINRILLSQLRDRFKIEICDAPCESGGILSRCRIMWNAWRNRSLVLHVTGDIHFAALLRPKKNVIQTFHDCGFLHGPKTLRRLIREWLWFRLPIKYSAAVICVSEFTRQEIIRFYGCDPGNLFVIPNPVNPELKPELSHEFSQSYPVILQVGTTPNKNIPRLAEALAGIQCHLNILGPIDAETQQALVRHSISFMQFAQLTPEKVRELYATCDLVTYCSTYEGFGLPILEAQATGKPLITSNLNPMNDVAGAGAEFIDPLDPKSIRTGILRVIKEPKRRQQLIEAGFENIRRFNIESIASSYAAVYQKVLKP